MTRYAEGTTVTVDKSRVEAERVLVRYGASGFAYGWDQRTEVKAVHCSRAGCEQEGRAIEACRREHAWDIEPEERIVREVVTIQFKFKERAIRLTVPMPTEREAGTKAKLEAATRQRWRALVLVIKAKLEAVASGISSLEAEFMANVVTDSGETLGEILLPRMQRVVERGLLLPPASTNGGEG